MKKRLLTILLAATMISMTGCLNSEIEKPNEGEISVNPADPGSDGPSKPVEEEPESMTVSTVIIGDNAILNISPVDGALGYEVYVNGTLLEKISETTYTLNNTQVNVGLNEISIKAYNESGYIESVNTTVGKLSTPTVSIEDNILTITQDVDNAIGYKIYDEAGAYITNIRAGSTYDFNNMSLEKGEHYLSIQSYGSHSVGWLPSERETFIISNKSEPTCEIPHQTPKISFHNKYLTISLDPTGTYPQEETLRMYINEEIVCLGRDIWKVFFPENIYSQTFDFATFDLKVGDVITVKTSCAFEEDNEELVASITLTEEHFCYDAPIEDPDFTEDPENPGTAKPVIYLYPEETMEISVELDYNGMFTTTYPSYNNGWKVVANPDGTINYNGREYYCLFWEGISNVYYQIDKGFCVKGEDTEKFLEESLKKLGLTDKEANEFIIYWLPKMENNAYNVISFQEELYTENAELTISPAPDTLIRVFMAWKGVDEFVKIEPQTLTSPERNGFTVIEWGGSELK